MSEMRILGYVLFYEGVPERENGRFVIYWDIREVVRKCAANPGLTIETFWGTGEKF